MRYAITLIYPDYLSNQYGEDFYVSFIDSDCAEMAVEQARALAQTENPYCDNPEDFGLCSVVSLEDLEQTADDILIYTTFERFYIALYGTDAFECSQPGRDADQFVKDVLEKTYVRKQLDIIPFDSIRSELREYGAWYETELANDQDNAKRLIWIAARNIRDEIS